jgi:uncharacterized glyoxalase superfamily protein PhnB
MGTIDDLAAGIMRFRPFLQAKDFEASLGFYEAIGFQAYRLGPEMAEMSLGDHAFILHKAYVKDWADNMVMHVLVNDVQAWWRQVQSLDLPARFGVALCNPPRVEPWGLTVLYVTDPTGILWHFAQPTES